MQVKLGKNVIPFTAASAKSRRAWWMYIKFPPKGGARVTGTHQHVTVWIGPFSSEGRLSTRRGEYEAELERLEYKDYQIYSVPSGRSYPNPEKSDIDPDWSAEQAIADLPRILAYKTEVSKV